jgi:hypothetical protein
MPLEDAMIASTLDAEIIRTGPPEWIDSEALYEIIEGEYLEKEPAVGALRQLHAMPHFQQP